MGSVKYAAALMNELNKVVQLYTKLKSQKWNVGCVDELIIRHDYNGILSIVEKI